MKDMHLSIDFFLLFFNLSQNTRNGKRYLSMRNPKQKKKDCIKRALKTEGHSLQL